MNNIKLASPSEMSARERAGEITTIVANAITRVIVHARVAEEPKDSEINLVFLPHQSVHTTPYPQEKL